MAWDDSEEEEEAVGKLWGRKPGDYVCGQVTHTQKFISLVTDLELLSARITPHWNRCWAGLHNACMQPTRQIGKTSMIICRFFVLMFLRVLPAFSFPRTVSRSFPCWPWKIEEITLIKGKRERINILVSQSSFVLCGIRTSFVTCACDHPEHLPKGAPNFFDTNENVRTFSHTHTYTLMWRSRCPRGQEKGRVVRWGGGRGGRGWGH